ncbi:helix-hairpin-helix domain-containing protein [Flavobacterium keumense]|uniref:Helix-hairpin-helix domain-containing protein n=1 Tax=Flavobacterium keumense TaxID=1306518 RepID=A0ABY8N4Y0_9FLAO|nr:helix-hairpin-helix domain-containing protein [Flavobacterium keumense]WGK94688.1 helix-hairpin-helix domain-containing protein [Flavobacterium keumense]
MNFKKCFTYFNFSKSQRSGLLALLVLIVVLQTIYFFVDFSWPIKQNSEKEKWLAVQIEIDSLKSTMTIKESKLYPFNPNFISDYKGYKLGMNVKEIERLLSFRKQNKFVNSAEEFQKVTQVSDSLLRVIAPYFKFPDWVNHKTKWKTYNNPNYPVFINKGKPIVIDINMATTQELVKVYGVGEVIAQRIVSYKESLGAFVDMEQLNEVWGLSPEVLTNLNKQFKVKSMTGIKKVDVNNASIKELAQFPYFKYAVAKQIVIYRSMNGTINSVDDLIKIKNFPVDKAKIISLYLDF